MPAGVIDTHGAVSAEVARAMAEGVRTRCDADVGLSTTGIAGPGGGSEDKPVGTVWIGLADSTGTTARCFRFTGDRPLVRRRTVLAALQMLRFRFDGVDAPLLWEAVE